MAACILCNGTLELLDDVCPLCDGDPFFPDDVDIRTDGSANLSMSSTQAPQPVVATQLLLPGSTPNTPTVEQRRAKDGALYTYEEFDVYYGLERGVTEWAQAAGEHSNVDASVPSGDFLGNLEVNLLSGRCILVPVHAGDSMAIVKTKVFAEKPALTGMLPQLLHPTGTVQDHDAAADFMGVPLTYLLSRKEFSQHARKFLRRCQLMSPDDCCINLLEIDFKVSNQDVDALIEVLLLVQPRRLILKKLGRWALWTLSKTLQDVLVEVLHVYVTRESLHDLARLFRRCPNLRQCYVCHNGLTAVDVKDIRAQTKATIVI